MCSREREVHELVAGKTPAEAEEPAKDFKSITSQLKRLDERFYREEYELVIASNVRTIYFATHEEIPLIAALELHATSVLHDTPVNLKALLKPLGRLFLQEFSPEVKSMAYVMLSNLTQVLQLRTIQNFQR
ncbi:uncharacterized protein ATNIH1004_006389 [Aspergillus tanneri]|uniref:Uncharacterized protein n=1 Tax=Aspergillus tanneri TaxID=1220188 RepID=A0A5M9ML08_9EURO|nr:uncharacterized protein ATNIH1004_006389 [Aspergillus tanneri]KAA8647695.1 hypothetical protein ATNIH1004_006389 [Aspergillus tanneri]